mgnify:CR=1 FL=1
MVSVFKNLYTYILMTNNDDPRRSPTSVVDLPETSIRKLNCNSGWRELDNKNVDDLYIIKKITNDSAINPDFYEFLLKNNNPNWDCKKDVCFENVNMSRLRCKELDTHTPETKIYSLPTSRQIKDRIDENPYRSIDNHKAGKRKSTRRTKRKSTRRTKRKSTRRTKRKSTRLFF